MRLLIAILLLALTPTWSQSSTRPQRTQRPKPKAAPRSRAARAAFQRANPCPATHKPTGACPGYIVDHIIALACGGPDTAANMQWQTLADAKRKDRTERTGCQAR